MRSRFLTLVMVSFFLSGGLPLPAQALGAASACDTAYGQMPGADEPAWLEREVSLSDLATQYRYDLLSGHLLKSGFVDGASCPGGGLNGDGSPNGCGLEMTAAAANEWQNRYGAAIRSAAQAGGLPLQVLKAVIAVESQFWPAPDWMRGEIGLGQMTASGADLALQYRPMFYQQICRQVLGEEACQKPYFELPQSNQFMLQGLVLRSIDAACPTCPGGIDPDSGSQAVTVLAETLSASCAQSGRVFRLGSGKLPAEKLSYEDFWRFTLANYHSGAGCLFQALRLTGDPSSWQAISTNLTGACASGREYIRRIETHLQP